MSSRLNRIRAEDYQYVTPPSQQAEDVAWLLETVDNLRDGLKFLVRNHDLSIKCDCRGCNALARLEAPE